MDTVHKLFEALLFAVLGVLFYVWQMRQIRTDQRKAAEQSAAKPGSTQDAAPAQQGAQQDTSGRPSMPSSMDGPVR